MGNRAPEQPLRNSGEPDDETWATFHAELMGKEATPSGIGDADREMREHEDLLRKQELQRRVFEIDDLLRRSPNDFPDRRILSQIATAAGSLINPSSLLNRESRIRTAIVELADALDELRREADELSQAVDDKDGS